jgi:spermidine synthase
MKARESVTLAIYRLSIFDVMKKDGNLSLLEPAASREVHLPGKTGRFVSCALFLSGMTSLVYETVWQRMLVRETGTTLPAVSMIFAVFIGGLALGSFLSIPLLRKRESALAVYGFAELALAAFGVGIPLLFGERASMLAALAGSVSVENALYLVLLLIPATIIGVTFNCVARYIFDSVSAADGRAQLISEFYFVNLVGGVFGALLAVFVLIPNLGLSIASMSMALANLCAFFILIGCSLAVQRHDDPLFELLTWLSPPKVKARDLPVLASEAVAESSAKPGFNFRQSLFLIGSTSFIIMMLEVAFTRLLMLLLGSSTYSVGLVLSIVLAAFAVAAWFVSRVNVHVSTLTYLLCGGAVSMLLVAGATPYLPLTFLVLQQSCSQFLSAYLAFLVPRMVVSLCMILPCMLLLGSVFPLLLKASTQYREEGRELGTRWTGYALSCSSIGSIFGSLFAAFVLIPKAGSFIPLLGTESGIETTFRVCSVLLLFLAVASFMWLGSALAAPASQEPEKQRASNLAVLVIAIVFVFVSLMIFPRWNLQLLTLGPAFYKIPLGARISQAGLLQSLKTATGPHGLLFYKEGTNETVSVEENVRANIRFLKNDGKSDAALPIDWRRAAPTTDAGTHLALGLLPFLFCSSQSDLKALVIGFGSGITSGAIACNPALSRLTMAELEPAVYKASRAFEPANLPVAREQIDSGKVKLMFTDGRNLLRRSSELYDAIISQPSEPWISGASDLFTFEFWQLAKSRLKPGGAVCQWIQLYSIDQPTLKTVLGTFQRCFQHTTLVHFTGAGEVLLVGTDGPLKPVGKSEIDAFLAKAKQPVVDRLSNNYGTAVIVPDFACDIVLNTEQLSDLTKDTPLNTDDRLLTEYVLPQQTRLLEDCVESNLHWLSAKMKEN